jgi:hypothetical protein
VHRGNFSLIAAVIDLKRITVPVFLIYAGVIHVIGLALLLPMIVTLPGPGSMIAPKGTPVAVELDAAEADPDQTAALSAPPKPVEDNARLQAAPEPVAPGPKADAKPDIPAVLANASPTAQPGKSVLAAPQPKSQAKPTAANRGTAVKKPVVQRSAKPTVRRSAKKDTKIAPFSGNMSGLFTPGAPSNRK